MKKFLNYPVFLVITLSIIGLILFGALLRHHYLGFERFQTLQKIAVFFAEVPFNVKKIFEQDINTPLKIKRHVDKKRFVKYLPNQRESILVLPRYDHSLNRSVIDIIDLYDFNIIHTYAHDISEMLKIINDKDEFKRIHIDDAPIRFEYRHPLILDDGSLISDSDYAPLFKIDFCSNLVWINQEEKFHHSIELDHQNNLWIPGQLYPYSKYISANKIGRSKLFHDDAIIKLDTSGNILYKKSVSEILIENKKVDVNFFNGFNYDPIHLNDIEPALTDSEFWKKGDVFLSVKHQSAIVHFRPSSNKIINIIKGPFAQQHDVDIISSKEISIFNNNNFLIDDSYSEVLIYNFENQKFTKKFNNQLKVNSFKTQSQGLSQFLNDGSLLVEEQNYGRIILFNNKGQKEWQFVNKDLNGDIGFISWSRVLEDKTFIKK